jgi:methylmalonyl-CoA/ethylmalonyl-CoA epimerase
VSIAVPDIAAAAEALEARLGLKAGPIEENAGQGVRLAYVELGNAKIELIEPTSPSSPIARFLERYPAGGLHHVCLGVGDLEAVLANATAAGARLAGKPAVNVHGDRIAFLDPKDVLGALVELEEHNR